LSAVKVQQISFVADDGMLEWEREQWFLFLAFVNNCIGFVGFCPHFARRLSRCRIMDLRLIRTDQFFNDVFLVSGWSLAILLSPQ
jgi:hypothetical protein